MKVGDFVRHKANHEINGVIIEIKIPELDLDDPFIDAFKDMMHEKKCGSWHPNIKLIQSERWNAFSKVMLR